MALGDEVSNVFKEKDRLSSLSCGPKPVGRIASTFRLNKSFCAKTVREQAAMARMIELLNKWDSYVVHEPFDIGSRTAAGVPRPRFMETSDTFILRGNNCRSFLFILPKFEDIERMANTLSLESTCAAIAHKNKEGVPLCVKDMDSTMIYTIRIPNITDSECKHFAMLVIPVGKPFSTMGVFRALQDITPLGCILPAHFVTAITKTGWRSMGTDKWGKFRHIGLGVDKNVHPFLMCCNVGQAKTM
ncbi:hypothetical protein T484DRAFT_1758550 [Baffinella frigidus]|nr:hypothetical protein T484DRAFT_1758550 [Cryptophyta sp. CCMP2293]